MSGSARPAITLHPPPALSLSCTQTAHPHPPTHPPAGGDYSTKFAPWLAAGCLSPRQVYHEIKRYEAQRGSNKSTYWVIFELIWRDYFRWVGKGFSLRNDLIEITATWRGRGE